ncbi:MAG: beta-lactamase family protein [Mesorhizobium sp.]|nr:MAG: beta-lactamase family protein [Mesorhizobium sp.]
MRHDRDQQGARADILPDYPAEDRHQSIARWYRRYFGVGRYDERPDEVMICDGSVGPSRRWWPPCRTSSRRSRERPRFPGFAVAVVHGGKMIFDQGYGLRGKRNDISKFSSTTIFQLASVSKSISATVAAIAMTKDHSFDWHTTDGKVWDGFRLNRLCLGQRHHRPSKRPLPDLASRSQQRRALSARVRSRVSLSWIAHISNALVGPCQRSASTLSNSRASVRSVARFLNKSASSLRLPRISGGKLSSGP